MIRSGHDFWANLSTGKWAIIIESYRGLTLQSKSIIVPKADFTSKDYLDSFVHEALHASLQNMTEKEVVRVSHDIVEVLWKRGYRLPVIRKKKKRQTKG